MHRCTLTDGYETITRDEATPAQLFELAHDLLVRLDGLEWAFACLALITLQHMDVIGMPKDPTGYRDTLATLQEWLHDYRESQDKIERDRVFLNLPE